MLTGKGFNWGGSLIRPEATGYGAVYFAAEMLATRGKTLEGKLCLVSGSGNVAQYTIEKILQLGGKVLTVSDSDGYIYDEAGITTEKLAFIMELKNVRRERIKEYTDKIQDRRVHSRESEAGPQSALEPQGGLRVPERDAERDQRQGRPESRQERRLRRGEGANMPTTLDGVRVFLDAKILYGPGKAANAGGVAVSGLEMAQNSMRLPWTREEVDDRLRMIMKNIHATCVQMADRFGTPGNYVNGANIGGFLKVADAMMDQGVV